MFKNGQWKFLFRQKNWGHFFTLFWSKIWPFLLKNQVFGCFLENRLSEFHVTWSETRDNYFQSFNGSFVSGEILFWPFWPIFGQKYIACGDKLRFLTIFDQFRPICWCLFDNFWSYGFGRKTYGFTLVRACVRASVRASHHIWRSAHQILMIFCTKLHLDESKKMFQADFWKKILVWPFLAKILKTRIFSKIRLEHFLDSSRCSFVQKIIKIWCVVF